MDFTISKTEDIERIVASAVQEGIARAIPDLLRRATQKPYLTKEEVMELTGWSGRTLQHLRSSGQLAFSKHGRKILYPSEAVYAFLKGASVQARKAARPNPITGEGQS